ncbi:hypothetical protein IPZ68_39135 [Streptomyces arenae]|nr:hypothetical protein [Streptomyces arenae]
MSRTKMPTFTPSAKVSPAASRTRPALRNALGFGVDEVGRSADLVPDVLPGLRPRQDVE